WRKEVAEAVDCEMVEVITNVIMPVEIVSDKENFSAGTLRPRIHRQLGTFLTGFKSSKLDSRRRGNDKLMESISLDDIESIVRKLKIDRSVPASKVFFGGPVEASNRLKAFIAQKLDSYGERRNDPSLDIQSHLSPYLHFGQISPLEIALAVAGTNSPGKDAFLEELIVRRELAFNYVWYNRRYDEYGALPSWAINTLNVHAKDKREYVYTLEQFESGKTHDPAWNAAQMEMVLTGKMHNYMRMYWGKKILEWTRTPRQAFEWAVYLNNKYQLDGRDPNSFAGVAWCFGKHDRPWGERAVFGKVRYMNYAGLKRKFDPQKYIGNINSLSVMLRK
ncbi:MAG: deoxyribodipyrimidine photolyase, partial [Anaerohalosphaeraceae bacterium]